LSFEVENRVATGEEQPQPFVRHVIFIGDVRTRCFGAVGFHLQKCQSGGVGAISAQDIDGSPPSHGQQPSGWPAWHPIDGPALQCRRDRIGGDLLRQVEVAELSNECSEQPAPFLAEYGLDGVGCSLAQWISVLSRLDALELHDRPDLHRSVLGPRAACRPVDGRVEIGYVEQVVPAQDLAGLRERTVGDHPVTILKAYRRCCLGRLQGGPTDLDACIGDCLFEGPIVCHDLVHNLLRRRLTRLLAVDQQ